MTEKLNNLFVYAVTHLEIEPYMPENMDIIPCFTIDDIIERYKFHPSITKIKENVKTNTKFSFADVSSSEFQEEIRKLNTKKASVENDIPTKIIIGSSDIISIYLSEIYNEAKNHQDFPEALKLAGVIPIQKAKEKISKKDYRPISLLPIISKIYEKIMYNQINSYVDNFLSSYLFGFRKGHSTEQ